VNANTKCPKITFIIVNIVVEKFRGPAEKARFLVEKLCSNLGIPVLKTYIKYTVVPELDVVSFMVIKDTFETQIDEADALAFEEAKGDEDLL
jgi:hypothetical protein